MIKSICCFNIGLLLCFFLSVQTTASQNNSLSDINYIQDLIEQDSLIKARLELKTQIALLNSQKNYNALVNYIPLVGSFKLVNGDIKTALTKAETFVTDLKKANNTEANIKAAIELSNIYFNARQYNKIYKTSKEALKDVAKVGLKDQSKISQLHYNIGTASLNLGNNADAKKHLYKSMYILGEKTKTNLVDLYNTYNSVGRFHSNITQLDSSTYYYKKALETLTLMDSTETNRDYWKAIVNNNISLNFQNTGKTNNAIEYITHAINDFQKFINISKDESKTFRAKRYRLATIDNLATFYDGIGEFKRAVDLLTYSYQEKLKFLKQDDPNIVFSLVILGHTNLRTKNYKKAAEYTDKALSLINKNPSNNTFLHSYTLSIRASIHEAIGNFKDAKRLYLESEALYNKTFDGNYANNHLDAILEMSRFYTKINDREKALQLAAKAYHYTQQKEFENELIKFYHTQNMAEVHFGLKNYSEALNYSNKALSFFRGNAASATTLADSIQIEFKKPSAIFVNAKSKYQLKKVKDTSFLKQLTVQVEEGIKTLEQRKIIIKTHDDLNLLIEDNNHLFDFAKQLKLDIYNRTKNETFLLDAISIHESSLYNRIRSRLNLKNDITFANVPLEITFREKQLKNKLLLALNESGNSTIDTFLDAETNWNSFLDSLKQGYPKYYKMRYATIEEPLNEIQENIPEHTTVVRYLFIEDKLYAFIADKTTKSIIPLEFGTVKNIIQQLTENQTNIDTTSLQLYTLFKQLWKPLEDKITTENVIIIPDAQLFNLSFETLTPNRINSFKDLATNSLLAKYNISYNYSLLLLANHRKTITYDNNFIAFVPEFNDKMKDDYRISITDSLNLDKTYLTLLPQPFSIDLAKEYSKLFKGEAFINEKASKTIFKNEANEHKIIHIGTHAESNNVSPELSRLIFAKNASDENNSLYTYEIYNQNLNSNLAILTACETGKPTYQAGEGMISLAHAFNYAGSESILTSLWKIDEQSSTQIINLFYRNISNGFPKDKALKQAKLEYIASAEGRTISPQYWAGLVLIGDASHIDLQTSSNLIFWILGILAISLIALFFKKKRKQ